MPVARQFNHDRTGVYSDGCHAVLNLPGGKSPKIALMIQEVGRALANNLFSDFWWG